jgi:hypothetical protein
MGSFYVYADSRNRAPGTFGNSYTLTLTTPVRNVKRVDLVVAKVPNSLYNITQPGSIQVNSNTFSITPGFYNAPSLAAAVSSTTGVQTVYLPNQGKFQFASNVTALTTEMQNALGIFTGNMSSNVINLSTEEFVFLDIMELRNRSVIDAKTLVGETYAGSTIATSFAMIPLDVFSGQFKTFKETTDYKMSVSFDSPIPRLTRLTISWLNKDGLPVNFNGLDINSFVLRFHCLASAPEPDEEPPLDEELLLRKIQRAVEDAVPKPKPKSPWRFAIIPFLFAILFLVSRTLRGGNKI